MCSRHWCRLCCADLEPRKAFMMRHGPIDYFFCDENHAAIWERYRLDPKYYVFLRSLPSERVHETLQKIISEYTDEHA